MIVTRSQIDELLQFQNADYLVTSCYVGIDRAAATTQELKIRAKDLFLNAHRVMDIRHAGHEQRASLQQDLERIEAHVSRQLAATPTAKAVAMFSCAARQFWHAYELPSLRRDLLVADHDPYVRPLTGLLEEYHRYGTILVDRSQGQFFEMYMGEITHRAEIADSIPRQPREAGIGGRDERRIERHHDNAVHHHYQRLADAVFDLFQRDKFDWLILGGRADVLGEFKPHLHAYLAERLVGEFAAEPGKTPLPEVLACSREVEERTERDLERRYVAELMRKKNDMAVVGLHATLPVVARGQAQMLLVDEGFASPGFACFACHHVGMDDAPCPTCQKPVVPCPDVVDETIEAALTTGCKVEHVRCPTPLRDAGRIGALLRFKT
jgi:peptide chain release factor subunit 1